MQSLLPGKMLGFSMQEPQSSHRLTTVYAEAQPVDIYSSLQFVEGPAYHACCCKTLYSCFCDGSDIWQVGFFNIVGIPLFKAMVDVFEGMQPMLDAVQANCRYWESATESAT